MRLARALGKFPHEIDELPYSEFLELRIYDAIEPLMGEASAPLSASMPPPEVILAKMDAWKA